jgi:hypothetical protein
MTIEILIGIGGLAFGIFSWFTSGILKDKGKIIEHEVKIGNIEKDIIRLEKRMDDVE